jgi:hypothetical protein
VVPTSQYAVAVVAPAALVPVNLPQGEFAASVVANSLTIAAVRSRDQPQGSGGKDM